MEALDQTHRQMMDALVELQRLIDHLADHGIDAVAQSASADICGFFGQAAREHHAAEESHVFPVLLRSGDAALIQHVERLQQDHGWLEEDWLELAPQLQAVWHGYSWYDLDTLRHGVGIFTALYHEHIALEESLIYPEARRRLAEESVSRGHRIEGDGS
jgi:hemerythrin-like domain-containing protein